MISKRHANTIPSFIVSFRNFYNEGSGLEEINAWMDNAFWVAECPLGPQRADTEHDSVKGVLATKWLWGHDTKHTPVGATRNGLPQLRFLCSDTRTVC